MKEPEATDSLLEGFKELIGDIVPAVATAAVEPSIKTAHKQWAADLSNVAKEMQAQLDASLLSIESTFASVSQQLSATADGFENAVSSEKQGLWQALGEYRQETERIAAELSSFAEAASKAVSDSENFAVQLTVLPVFEARDTGLGVGGLNPERHALGYGCVHDASNRTRDRNDLLYMEDRHQCHENECCCEYVLHQSPPFDGYSLTLPDYTR